MDIIKKQALIEHIKKNKLSEVDKKLLIELINNNDLERFLKQFFSLCKLGVELLKFFDFEDFHPQ